MATYRIILVNENNTVVYPPIYAEGLEECFDRTQNDSYLSGSWFDSQDYYKSTNPKLLAKFEERREAARSTRVGDIFQDVDSDKFFEVMPSGFKEIQ